MKTLAAGWTLGMAAALAGCALPERKTDAELIAAAPTANTKVAGQDEHQMTGSRIPKRTSTDRSLRTIGSRDARDAMDAAPRPLDAGGG